MSRRLLRVLIVDARGRPLRRPALASWLSGVAPRGARGAVNVVLVTDRRMRQLNRLYRGKDYATDVLSFGEGTGFLGDIVIATGVVRRQARRFGHSELTELRILALHGLLHLMGYDHDVDDGAMARVERRLRRRGGLREGLMERSTQLRP